MEILSTEGADLAFSTVRGKVAALTCGIEEETISLAVVLVERGCRVVLIGSLISVRESCRRVSELCDLCTSDKLSSIPDSLSVRAVEWDATRGEEQVVERSVEEAWHSFGGINILINSVSVSGTIKPALEMSKEDYDNIMNANVKASWLLTTAVAKKMLMAGIGGSVIFSLLNCWDSEGIYPGVSIYGTSMAAINHLIKMMALELGKHGIRVNAIACGLTSSNAVLESNSKESLQKLGERVVPLRRWSRFPNDIIGVLLWLAGDFSSFVTGTTTIVDGGLSIRRPRIGEYRPRSLL